MKKLTQISISIILAVICLLGLTACGDEVEKTGLWKNATYLSDTTLGEGEKTAVVQVKAGEQSVTFTVNTNNDILGDALLEHKLIEGEEQKAGFYIKKVNGITADFEVDQSYWAFYVDGKYASSGVDTTKIEEGVTYKLEYTK